MIQLKLYILISSFLYILRVSFTIWTSNDFNVYVKDTAKEHEIYEVYLKQAIPVLNMLQGSTNSKDLREILVKIIMDVLDDNSINILFLLVNELISSRDEEYKK